MKPVLAFLFLLLLSSPALHSAEPSRQETVAWLKTKLEGHTTITAMTHTDGARGTTTLRWTDLAITDKQIQYTVTRHFKWSDEPAEAPKAVQTVAAFANLAATAKAVNAGGPRAGGDLPYFIVVSVPATKSGTSGISIEFDPSEKELAERVAKALNHLIRLSGGAKKEAF